MNFEFSENSVIIIPFVHKNCRLDDGEKVRFRCLFKNVEGDFPYTLDIEEDNKGEKGADGKYTISVDTATKGILPGRYQFDLSLVLASGSLVTLKTKDECCIEIIPAAEGLYKPNGDVYFGADYIVEQGSSDIWTYRKWASGIAECWARVTNNLVINRPFGSLYASDGYIVDRLAFPFRFSEIPVVAITCSGDLSVTLINSGGSNNVSRSQVGNWQIIRPTTAEEEKEYIANISAIGRWK